MARHERVNQIPGAAGPLPAADPRCEELHRAQPGRQGPALAISPRGAGCSQGEADGTWERVPGTRGGWHSAAGKGRDAHGTRAGSSLGWTLGNPAQPGARGCMKALKKDGNQMNNKQRKLPELNQEVRQRLTCLGFEVTAPFSSDRTVMGGVGFFPHPNFGG